ncbi:hypothetical protein TELCIR_25146, partial [Teladorsagia circumcincta]
MDLSEAYMQVELDKESRKYTTVNTQKGLYEYNRIAFGIASAPAIFQKIMETTLAGIEGVVIYLDDITVTGPDDDTHLERLDKVLQRLKAAGFRLKRTDVLAHYDPDVPVVLATDASDYGLGAVIYHKYKDGTEK